MAASCDNGCDRYEVPKELLLLVMLAGPRFLLSEFSVGIYIKLENSDLENSDLPNVNQIRLKKHG